MSEYATMAEVRAWLRDIEPDAVTSRGRLADVYVEAYNRAHPGRPYATPVPRLKGGPGRWAGHTQTSRQPVEVKPDRASAAEVRAWARRVSPVDVPDRGTLPLALVKAYNQAHPERPFRTQWDTLDTFDAHRAGQYRLGGLRRRNPNATLED